MDFGAFLSDTLSYMGGFFSWIWEIQVDLFTQGIALIGTWWASVTQLTNDIASNIISYIATGLYQLFDISGSTAYIKPVFDFFDFVIKNLIEVIDIIGLILTILLALGERVFTWVREVAQILTAIFAGILGAPPTSIPGLPRCITAPLESDICAVWYAFEHTILADGTPGDLYIPLIVFAIDLVIIFYLIKTAIRIAKLFEELTNVG